MPPEANDEGKTGTSGTSRSPEVGAPQVYRRGACSGRARSRATRSRRLLAFSEETAKADLRDYRQGYAPDLKADPRDNIYRVSINFVPRVSRPNPETCLGRLASRGAQTIPVATVPDVDRRRIDATILQSVVRAIRNRQEIETYYRSPRAETARCYRIVPRALFHDGFRWSVRCYIRRETGDHWGELVLDRVEEVSAEAWPAEVLLIDGDEEWRTIINLEFT